MREIKFRVWGTKNPIESNLKEMDYLPVISNFGLNEIFSDIDLIFMQYTGITDQTGKEIYEMDIVKKGDEIGLVIYDNGEYDLIWTPHNKKRKAGAERLVQRNPLNNTHPSPVNYVLGNYYENRDLIPEIDYELIKTYTS